MNDSQDNYDIAAIRELLLSAFGAAELRRFCQDRPSFRPVLRKFGREHGLDDMVDEVLDYCERQGTFRGLLADIESEYPRQYQEHAPYTAPSTSRRQSYSAAGAVRSRKDEAYRQEQPHHKPPDLLDIVARVADLAGFLAFGYVLVDWARQGFRLSEIDLVSATTLVGLLGLLYLVSRLIWEVRRFLENGSRHQLPFTDRRYRQHLINRHRFFDVKGLSTQGIYTLELERVFVELTIAPRSVHEATTDPIQSLPENARRGQSIWSYLNLEALTHQNLVIIGPPGCGKTTLLKHMALTLTAGRAHRRKWKAPNRLPILLFLRDHAQTIQSDPSVSLAELVCDALAGWNLEVAPGWFESRLGRGHCLVMLDGLDEVADSDARRQVVAWVQRQMEACGGNRFVVTSRPYGYYDHRLSGVTVLQVSPFTRDQVERFVHNWYTANEIMSAQKDDAGVRQDAAKGASDLLQRLRSTSDLADLAVNPLLLTMIATVHRYRSSLPGRRVELYKEICDVFLGQHRQARGLTLDLTPAQKQEVLQPLAYHLMCQARREAPLEEAISVIAESLAHVSPRMSAEAFLKGIENESGLLVERENHVYAFSHKTFQEHLSSAHVIGNQDLEAELAQRVGEDWWHETIRLYVAQTDASAIIEGCLAGDPPNIPALTLAIECQEEALRLQPALRHRLEKVLSEGVESPDLARRRLIAEALLALRLRHMVRVDEDHYVDNTLVTHAEYEIFLAEKRSEGEFYQPDHWMDYQFSVGDGRKPVVGVRPSDATAFCAWLTRREGGEWRYRLPWADEPVVDSVEQAKEAVYWIQNGRAFTCASVCDSYSPISVHAEQIDRDLALTLVFACALDPNFDHDLDLTLARTRTLERAKEHPGSLAIDRSLDRVLARALDLSRIRGSDRALHHEIDLDITLDRVHALDRSLDVHLRSMRERTPVFHTQEAKRPLRQQVRLDALLLAAVLLDYLATRLSPWTVSVRPRDASEEKEVKVRRIADGYLDLYLDLCILEGRIEGTLPAFEGIRLVRERQPRQ
ncbi:MAG: NACHT domain-containing protein [Anaerolineae bacterium]|nr:NACHT domain-containing protein [Anaerolineae bacterium]